MSKRYKLHNPTTGETIHTGKRRECEGFAIANGFFTVIRETGCTVIDPNGYEITLIAE